MDNTRDWLVLSLKWSEGREWLVWYKTAASGYTSDLMHAGRYTAAESAGHEIPGVAVAVPIREALAMSRVTTQVPNTQATTGQMVKEADTRRASRHPGGPAESRPVHPA